ncbi:MAG: tetratricopeptide repeat protein [Chloroflexota bacterium]
MNEEELKTPEEQEDKSPESENNDAVAWLENLAITHGAKLTERDSSPVEGVEYAEDIPDWLRSMAPPGTELPARPDDWEPDTQPEETEFEQVEDEALDAVEAALAEVEEADTEFVEAIEAFELPSEEVEEILEDDLEEEPAVPATALPPWLASKIVPDDAVVDTVIDTADIRPEIDESVLATEEEAADIPAWLAEQPKPEGLETEYIDDEKMPDWLTELSGKPEQEEIVSEISTAEEAVLEDVTPPAEAELETPEWLQEVVLEDQEREEPALVSAEVDTEPDVPDWLRDLTEDETEEVVSEVQPEPIDEQAVEEFETVPEWLSGLTDGEPVVLEEVPADADEGPAIPADDLELPEWLREEIAAEPEPELEKAVTETLEETPEWLEDVELEEEEIVEAAIIAEEIDKDLEEILSEPSIVDEPSEELEEIEPEPALEEEAAVEEQPDLVEAQALVDKSQLDAVLDKYALSIEEGTQLEQVNSHLEQLVAENPNNIRVRQLLGDSYMRQGELEKALNEYREALSQI